MEMEKITLKKGIFNSWLASITVFLVGLVFIIGGSLGLAQVNENRNYYRETSAIIVEIVEIIDYDDREYEMTISYDVYVDYKVDEVEYHHKKIPNYSVKMNVGDVIKITYDSRKPEVPLMETTSQFTLLIVVLVLGAVIFVFGIAYLIKNTKKYMKRKKFIQDITSKGFVKRVNVDKVIINSSKNKSKYSKISCEVEQKKYQSELFLINPRLDTECTVNIYFYREEYDRCVAKNEKIKQYYIDLNSVERKLD